MRKFIFRLETVLRHRATVEGLREQEFTAAQGRLDLALAKMNEMRNEFQRILAARPGMKAGEIFDAQTLFDRERYLQTLQVSLESQERRVEAAKMIADEKRKILVEAKQARQVVEHLRGRELAVYKADISRLEQHALDELASLRHSARQREEETS